MKIKRAEFVKSCAFASDAEFYPQIAVAGRSNCGKSSLLNMLMGARLCKTSSTPGRTQLINVFKCECDDALFCCEKNGERNSEKKGEENREPNDDENRERNGDEQICGEVVGDKNEIINCQPNSFYFIDLPGYGYSAAQKQKQDEWSKRVDDYFRRGNIAQTLCLMDIRRTPSALDKTLINYLRDLNLPFTVVLTKADKLGKTQCGKQRIDIAAALGLSRDDVFVTSTAKNSGKDELLNRLQEILNA